MIINIVVTPDSKKNTITKIDENKYEVTLKAKPENNQANKLLIEALAEYFELPSSSFKILTGHHTRNKRIEILT